TSYLDPSPYRKQRLALKVCPRGIRIVVIMHKIVGDDGTRMRAKWTSTTIGAGTILRGRPGLIVDTSRRETRLVLIPLAVLNDEASPCVGPRVASSTILRMGMGEDGVTVGSCSYILGRSAHITGI